MTSPWAAVIAAGVTAVLAFAAQAWAKKGDRESTFVDQLAKRVARLENLELWRGMVKQLDEAHILALTEAILRGDPPPPPQRPVYPPMPQ